MTYNKDHSPCKHQSTFHVSEELPDCSISGDDVSRSQSFSCLEGRKHNKIERLQPAHIKYENKRVFSLKREQSRFVKSWNRNSLVKRDINQELNASSLSDCNMGDICKNQVIQKSKTFSKLLSSKNAENHCFYDCSSNETSNGLQPADDEFLMQFNADDAFINKDEAIKDGCVSYDDNTFLAKAKLTQLLKTTQNEQLSKLQSKHQQECDILEDIRNFSKQKSQIDKEYAQSLQKLLGQYQKREWIEREEEEEENKISVLMVWKSLLNTTSKAAQIKINVAEECRNNILESAKNCRLQKDIQMKKCQELLTTIHNEVLDTVKELAKTKKKYFEMEQALNTAQEKFQEVAERLQKNQTSLFKSKTGLEKAVQKLQQKRDECKRNATVAKNEYLLMLSAANAHQKRYYEVDLTELMQILDGNIFDDIGKYIALLTSYETKASIKTQEIFLNCEQQTTKISREYQNRCFLQDNPIFEWVPLYDFDSFNQDDDEAKLVEEQDGTDNFLNREARKWTFKTERDKQDLEQLKLRLKDLEAMIFNIDQHSEILSSASTMHETRAQLQKCKEEIRQKEISCLLGEARLQLLCEANVDLDTWHESAQAQLLKNESTSTPGGLSRQKFLDSPNKDELLSPNIFSFDSNSAFYDDELDCDEDFSRQLGNNTSVSSNEKKRTYPITCVVIFPYQATRPDELSIAVGDEIEAIEDGDLDQWVKARNNLGCCGYVPENYLQFSSPAQNDYCNFEDKLSSLSPVSAHSSICAGSSTSYNDQEVMRINSTVDEYTKVCLAKAIYSYEACTEDELSFPVGSIVSIISKTDSGIDDGWWKGELNGKTGVFPAVVVEELLNGNQDFYEKDVYKTGEQSPYKSSSNSDFTVSHFTPLQDLANSFEAINAEDISSEFSFAKSDLENNKHAQSIQDNLESKSKLKRRAPPPPQRPTIFRLSFVE